MPFTEAVHDIFGRMRSPIMPEVSEPFQLYQGVNIPGEEDDKLHYSQTVVALAEAKRGIVFAPYQGEDINHMLSAKRINSPRLRVLKQNIEVHRAHPHHDQNSQNMVRKLEALLRLEWQSCVETVMIELGQSLACRACGALPINTRRDMFVLSEAVQNMMSNVRVDLRHRPLNSRLGCEPNDPIWEMMADIDALWWNEHTKYHEAMEGHRVLRYREGFYDQNGNQFFKQFRDNRGVDKHINHILDPELPRSMFFNQDTGRTEYAKPLTEARDLIMSLDVVRWRVANGNRGSANATPNAAQGNVQNISRLPESTAQANLAVQPTASLFSVPAHQFKSTTSGTSTDKPKRKPRAKHTKNTTVQPLPALPDNESGKSSTVHIGPSLNQDEPYPILGNSLLKSAATPMPSSIASASFLNERNACTAGSLPPLDFDLDDDSWIESATPEELNAAVIASNDQLCGTQYPTEGLMIPNYEAPSTFISETENSDGICHVLPYPDSNYSGQPYNPSGITHDPSSNNSASFTHCQSFSNTPPTSDPISSTSPQQIPQVFGPTNNPTHDAPVDSPEYETYLSKSIMLDPAMKIHSSTRISSGSKRSWDEVDNAHEDNQARNKRTHYGTANHMRSGRYLCHIGSMPPKVHNKRPHDELATPDEHKYLNDHPIKKMRTKSSLNNIVYP